MIRRLNLYANAGADLLVSFDEANDLMGLPRSRELEGRHLSAGDRERKYGRAAK